MLYSGKAIGKTLLFRFSLARGVTPFLVAPAHADASRGTGRGRGNTPHEPNLARGMAGLIGIRGAGSKPDGFGRATHLAANCDAQPLCARALSRKKNSGIKCRHDHLFASLPGPPHHSPSLPERHCRCGGLRARPPRYSPTLVRSDRLVYT